MRTLLHNILNSGWFVFAILAAVVALALADSHYGFFDGCNAKCHASRMTDEERHLESEQDKQDEYWRGP